MIQPAEVRSLFDRVAPRYDLLNRVLSGGRDLFWREAAARLLAPGVEGPILDLACGTLDLSLELSGRYPERTIIGCDFSSEMLARGRKKLPAKPIRLVSGDGHRLPFAANSFSGATIAFGIRNFADRPQALDELARVLKPGGRLLILELGTPEGVFGQVYLPYLIRLIPLIAKLISSDPESYVYLGRSILEFPQAREFTEMISRAGFRARSVALNRGIVNLYLGQLPG